MNYGQPVYTGALRLHVIPVDDRTIRLEYYANDPVKPNDVPDAPPVFFEEVAFEPGMTTWVSQICVGDYTTVQGSGFFLDGEGKRHFRMRADAGRYDTRGSGLGGSGDAMENHPPPAFGKTANVPA